MSEATADEAERKKRLRRIRKRNLKPVEKRRAAFYEMWERQMRRDEIAAAPVEPRPDGRDGNALELEYRRTDQDSGTHAYNTAESPLDLLLKKHIIEEIQYLAGTMFRRDYEVSSISPNRSVEIKERVQGGYPKNTLSEIQCDAQQRLSSALKAINGNSRIIVIALCGEGRTLTDIARAYGWNKHFIGPRAREALDELTYHYGLAARPRLYR